MTPVTVRRAARFAFLAAVVGSLAGCGAATASTVPASPVAAGSSGSAAGGTEPPTAVLHPTAAPSLTPVPGGQSSVPGPAGSHIATTQTDWGEILDGLPDTFPIYPDASPGEVPGEVVSGSFEAPVDVETLVAWYTQQLTERGYAVDTGDALEDGSRVMDVTADLPECRIQLTARPADGSTIMTVLVASACVNGTG